MLIWMPLLTFNDETCAVTRVPCVRMQARPGVHFSHDRTRDVLSVAPRPPQLMKQLAMQCPDGDAGLCSQGRFVECQVRLYLDARSGSLYTVLSGTNWLLHRRALQYAHGCMFAARHWTCSPIHQPCPGFCNWSLPAASCQLPFATGVGGLSSA